MELKRIGTKVVAGSAIVLLLVYCLSLAHNQRKKNQETETPKERFYRKGGKITKVEIIANGGELTSSNIAHGRDMSLYNNGGHCNCRRGLVLLKGEDEVIASCDIQKVRDFIWGHWRAKRRGYIRISSDSVDAVSTSHIFVEPDPNGEWHIAWRVARHLGEITELPDINSVERTQPNKVEGESGAYVLVFKDKEGDEIQRL